MKKNQSPDIRSEQVSRPGRWARGQSGNPGGRPGKGAKIRRALLEMSEPALKAILAGIEKGDPACLKLWADRCDPAPKSTQPPVSFLCDTTNLTQAALSVIAAISRGEVSPEVGTSIINAVAAAARVAEVDELRREVEALQRLVEEIQNDPA